jgi:hypothetical protein
MPIVAVVVDSFLIHMCPLLYIRSSGSGVAKRGWKKSSMLCSKYFCGELKCSMMMPVKEL